MIVCFDGLRRGWVDNCFIDLDEFWLCDETTNKTIFKLGTDGKEEGVRAFCASELRFTGEWSPQVEAVKEVFVTDSVLEELLGKSESWEESMEELTGVAVTIDRDSGKVHIGPGKPPDVKEALASVTEQIEAVRERLRKASEPEVHGDDAGEEEEPAVDDELEAMISRAEQALREPSAVKQEEHSPNEQQGSSPDAGEAEPEKMTASDEEAFKRGWEAAMREASKLAWEQHKKAKSASVMELSPNTASAEGAEAESESKPSAIPSDAREPKEQPQVAAEEQPTEGESKADEGGADVWESSFGGGESAAAEEPATEPAKEVEAEESRNEIPREKRRIIDWINHQDEFKHLPPISQDWIRVGRSSGNGFYFVNTKTGKTQMEEPLPRGWTQRKSRSSGIIYYWNEKQNITQLEKPTIAQEDPPAAEEQKVSAAALQAGQTPAAAPCETPAAMLVGGAETPAAMLMK